MIEESVCHIGNVFAAVNVIIIMVSVGATTCSGTGGEAAAVVMIMVRLLPQLLLKSKTMD